MRIFSLVTLEYVIMSYRITNVYLSFSIFGNKNEYWKLQRFVGWWPSNTSMPERISLKYLHTLKIKSRGHLIIEYQQKYVVCEFYILTSSWLKWRSWPGISMERYNEYGLSNKQHKCQNVESKNFQSIHHGDNGWILCLQWILVLILRIIVVSFNLLSSNFIVLITYIGAYCFIKISLRKHNVIHFLWFAFG